MNNFFYYYFTNALRVQLLVLIVAIAALLITLFFNLQQTKLLNKQLKLTFFSEYTKRYQEIMLCIPSEILDDNFDKELTNIELR